MKVPCLVCFTLFLLGPGFQSELWCQERIGYRLDTIARGLQIPWDMEFAPDGRIFITERPGRIRLIDSSGRLLQKPWTELEVANWQAAGLSGLAISPNFKEDGYIFVMGTFRKEGGYVNRIYRFKDAGERGIERVQIYRDLPSINTHSGGALDFGPDGMLYIAIGDNEDIGEVQKLDNTTGKILRIRSDGGIPQDNPFPDSPIWALGVRNPQGFSWHPQTGEFFATEHGPSGFKAEGYREHQDELNIIYKGANYGWPIVSGMHQDSRFVKPIMEWTPAIAPSGLAFDRSPDSPWFGELFVGALRGQSLYRLKLTRRGNVWTIKNEVRMFDKSLGRIRGIQCGPDGIYFTTSNIDTPGEPRRQLAKPGDDRIFRISLR